jgi:hypothetical protein
LNTTYVQCTRKHNQPRREYHHIVGEIALRVGLKYEHLNAIFSGSLEKLEQEHVTDSFVHHDQRIIRFYAQQPRPAKKYRARRFGGYF